MKTSRVLLNFLIGIFTAFGSTISFASDNFDLNKVKRGHLMPAQADGSRVELMLTSEHQLWLRQVLGKHQSRTGRFGLVRYDRTQPVLVQNDVEDFFSYNGQYYLVTKRSDGKFNIAKVEIKPGQIETSFTGAVTEQILQTGTSVAIAAFLAAWTDHLMTNDTPRAIITGVIGAGFAAAAFRSCYIDSPIKDAAKQSLPRMTKDCKEFEKLSVVKNNNRKSWSADNITIELRNSDGLTLMSQPFTDFISNLERKAAESCGQILDAQTEPAA